MNYRFRARDTRGLVQQGIVEAENADEAAQLLRRDGFSVLKLEEADEADDAIGILARRVRREEVIYATGQLALMIDTGITLSTALEGMIDQEENPTLRRVLRDIKSGVESGDDLSAALSRHPRLFDRRYVALVRASESTGTLGAMLERIGGNLRKELDTRQKVRAALAYPTVMAVLAVGVSVFLLTYVLPKFMPLFTRKDMDLPKPTAVLLAVSHALTEYWYFWLAGAVALVAGILFGQRTTTGRPIWDWIKLHFPILGPMQQKIVISRSIRTLGAMLNGGVPMLEALDLCSQVSANWHYEQLWKRAIDEITAGNQLSRALENSPLLPPTLVHMISSGEEAGRLAHVLERVSEYYDRDVEAAVKGATTLIEPILICVMGVVVGGIGLALLLPIFQLSSTH